VAAPLSAAGGRETSRQLPTCSIVIAPESRVQCSPREKLLLGSRTIAEAFETRNPGSQYDAIFVVLTSPSRSSKYGYQ